ncbi:MAG: TolC family protein, partial [Planctomycetes bacterium]|nr:TolC family protein [Planctomycetota bacterium]
MLRRCLVLALVALLAGCGSVRNAHRARNDIPPGERTVTAAEIGLDKNTVLTIDKAVEIALRYHPSVIQSQQRLLSARASFNSTRGSYLPQVDLSASSRLGTNNLSVSSANNDPSRSDSAGVSINQLFYDFGKTPASIRQSYQNLLAAESNYQSTINNMLYKVKEAYYDLIKQVALVRVAEETVRQF